MKSFLLLIIATLSFFANAAETTSSVYRIVDGKVLLNQWDETATGPVILKVFHGTEVQGIVNYRGAGLLGTIEQRAIVELGIIPTSATHVIIGAAATIVEGVAPNVTFNLVTDAGSYQIYSGPWASLVWEDRPFELPSEAIGTSATLQGRINNPYAGDGYRTLYMLQVQLGRVPDVPGVWRSAIEL